MDHEGHSGDYLFSYGTLREAEVQLSIFDRKLAGRPDRLIGYKLITIEIQDQAFVSLSGATVHRNLKFTGRETDYVEGVVLTVSTCDLERCDAYEPTGYQRANVNSRRESGPGFIWIGGQYPERLRPGSPLHEL